MEELRDLHLSIQEMEDRLRSEAGERASLILNQLASLKARLKGTPTPLVLIYDSPPPKGLIPMILRVVDHQPHAILFFYNTLLPIVTHNGYIFSSTSALLFLIPFVVLSFLMRFTGTDGRPYYALITWRGPILLSPSCFRGNNVHILYTKPPLSLYHFLMAFLKSLVFLAFALFSSHLQRCFFTDPDILQQFLFSLTPPFALLIYSIFVALSQPRN